MHGPLALDTSIRADTADRDRAEEKLAATLKGFVRRRAEELIAVPSDKRDEFYGRIHAAGAKLAAGHGWPESEASAWALKIVLFTRSMVRLLEEPPFTEGHLSRLEVVVERDRADLGRRPGSVR